MESISRKLMEALGHVQTGDLVLAEDAYAEALGECTAAYGETHKMTASTLGHLARTCAARGKLDLAVPMYERLRQVLDALSEAGEDVSADRAHVAMELASAYREAGNGEAAGKIEAEADAAVDMARQRLEKLQAEEDGDEDDDDDEDDDEDDDAGEGKRGDSDDADARRWRHK